MMMKTLLATLAVSALPALAHAETEILGLSGIARHGLLQGPAHEGRVPRI